MWKVVTLAVVFVSLAEVVLARLTTWLPLAIQTGVLAVAPPVALALILVAYFEWRAGLKRRIVADNGGDEEPAHAT
jgi:hypothetical protein